MRKLRENMKTVIIIVVLAFGGTAFYGFGGYIGGGGRGVHDDQTVNNIATIDGQTISRENFREELHRALSAQDTYIGEEMMHQFKAHVLDQIFHNMLVIEQAQKNIDLGEEDIDEQIHFYREMFESEEQFEQLLQAQNLTEEQFRELIRDELLYFSMLEKIVEPVSVTEEEIEKAYEQVKVRHILFRTDVDEESAREDAELFIDKVKESDDFAELAEQYSQEPDIFDGGELGYFRRGDIPELEDDAFALQPGEVSDLIETDNGYHIIKLIERKEAEGEEYEEERDNIKKELRQRRENEKIDQWYNELKEDADIEIHDPEIKAYNLRVEGQYDEAISAYRDAVRFYPENPYLYSNMGDIYAEQGKYEQAVEEYKQALESAAFPNPHFYYRLGEFYLNLDDRDSALENLTLALDEAEDDLYLYYLLTVMFDELEEEELKLRAEEELEKILQEEDEDFEEELIEKELLEEEVELEPEY